jgi:multidrug resistance efflux pump
MYERYSDEITDETRRIWLGRREEARKERARLEEKEKAQAIAQIEGRIKEAKLRLRSAEMWEGKARANLASMEASYKLTLDEIQSVGPAKAWEKRKRRMCWGSYESLMDEKLRKGEEIQRQTETLRKYEEEREAIQGEIFGEETKLGMLKDSWA